MLCWGSSSSLKPRSGWKPFSKTSLPVSKRMRRKTSVPFRKAVEGGFCWAGAAGDGDQEQRRGRQEKGRAPSGASHAAAPARAVRSPRAAVNSSAGNGSSGGA